MRLLSLKAVQPTSVVCEDGTQLVVHGATAQKCERIHPYHVSCPVWNCRRCFKKINKAFLAFHGTSLKLVRGRSGVQEHTSWVDSISRMLLLHFRPTTGRCPFPSYFVATCILQILLSTQSPQCCRPSVSEAHSELPKCQVHIQPSSRSHRMTKALTLLSLPFRPFRS
jgi:hypothetical protein